MLDLGNGFKNVCLFASVLLCPYLRIILSWNDGKKGRSLYSTSLRSWRFFFLGKMQRRGDRASGEAMRAETTQHYHFSYM